MTHILKILSKFADSILIGFNTFEIRKNGRQFRSGDYIRFQAVGDDGHLITHTVNDKDYKITYVLTCPKKDYVVLKIEEEY